MVVEVERVSLKYKENFALKNVSFKLEEGKVYGLLGRNGAGKTSLLSLLGSFREPTEGVIKVFGETPFENAKVMAQVGLIYDKDHNDEAEKVKNMLEIAERYRQNYDAEYAKHLVERFKLPLDRPVGKLSKGMKAALNVTIGLASQIPLTIFDEAYLGMDAPTREIFYQELLEDQSRNPRTFILSTHFVSEMDYLFDEVLILEKGELILQEEYEELVSRGASITGDANVVDKFVHGMKKLSEQQLGNTKSVMVYGKISDEKKQEALAAGLDVGPVALQDLFIHLTGKDE